VDWATTTVLSGYRAICCYGADFAPFSYRPFVQFLVIFHSWMFCHLDSSCFLLFEQAISSWFFLLGVENISSRNSAIQLSALQF